ncbi:Ig-like domain-containing protein, partial [Actinocorallia lasiicapitis]
MRVVWGLTVLAVTGTVVGVQSPAAAAPRISPSDGSTVTTGTVTVRAWASLLGGKLVVDGDVKASGSGEWLTYTLDGHAVANGTHKVELRADLPWDAGTATFAMAVPAVAPVGLSATLDGATASVSWAQNPEPDVTGYTLTANGDSKNIDAGSCGGRCTATFAVPAGATGTLPVTVRALRAKAGPSA